MNYQEANEQLTERLQRWRKIGNNTYLKRRGEDIAIKYHKTDIITFHPDKGVTVNVGGWKTITTKQRLNDYLENVYISQKNNVWYVSANNGDEYYYRDGMYIDPSGNVLNCEVYNKEKEKELRKLRRQIKVYSEKITDLAFSFKLEEPSGGDCWYCLMFKGVDTNHYISHFEDKYYVPSLFWAAMEESKNSMARIEKHNLAVIQNCKKDAFIMQEAVQPRIAMYVKKFLKKRLLV